MPRILSAVLLLVTAGAYAQQRPITPADFNTWRAINGQVLSHDGHYLAYGLFPQEGDGEVVVRDLKTGMETRQPAGQLPAPPPDDPTAEAPPPPRAIKLTFSGDSALLVFLAYPDRATVEKAKADKSLHPHESLVMIDLRTMKPLVLPDVKSVQLPDKSEGYLAYQLYGAPAPSADPRAAATDDEDEEDQRGARAGAGRGSAAMFGSTVVLRKLADGSERRFDDALEYQLTKDGKLLAYSVASPKPETDGVFAVASAGGEPKPLVTGRGRYEHLTFDEKQNELAFVGNPAAADVKKAAYNLYLWKTNEPAAIEVISASSQGFHAGWIVSSKGALTFSKDGSRLFFGASPVPPPPHATAIDEDKPSFDLWSYKDEQIQSIQKVRATADLNRSYRAVYLIAQRKMIQLADDSMPELQPNPQGRYALGTSDKQYRAMTDYGVRLSDTYLVDLDNGQRTLLAKKHEGRMQWSGDGRYAVLFDGKDWNSIAIPSGKTVNLTAKIPAKFFNEENDTPTTPGAYGLAGWLKDDKAVLLYDHYDLWQVAPDGTSATNLTAGFGRAQHLELRYVRLQPAGQEEDETRTIDPARPLLLRAEDSVTHDSGFYVTHVENKAAPAKLLMTATDVSMPIKAKDADVYVFSEQTFTEFPNLLVTNAAFTEPRRVTDANPQQAALAWGTDELVGFESLDGIPLQGIVYKPANFDAHKQYPMIVYLYEKLSQNVHHFVDPRPMDSINISTYVSNGYVVFTPDIVYTTGYPGQSLLKCVMAGVNSIVARGFVDEKNIGIQGHSWGGYQIAYMVTQTTRFKAAEDGAPVVDMISAYDGIRWGTGIPRQFQYEKTQSRIGGTPWQYPLRYIENSPIFMVDKITTPLLILHNDADDAVPWYQGIEFYLALRRLGKEAYLYSYNGEPHHLRRRANQKDYAVRMMQFFDYELKGARKPEWMEKGVPYLHTPEEFTPDQFALGGGK